MSVFVQLMEGADKLTPPEQLAAYKMFKKIVKAKGFYTEYTKSIVTTTQINTVHEEEVQKFVDLVTSKDGYIVEKGHFTRAEKTMTTHLIYKLVKGTEFVSNT